MDLPHLHADVARRAAWKMKQMTAALQMSEPRLSSDETFRYARHLVLPEVGPSGQLRLRRSRVLLVGAGGLGSPVALYLAAAGVGTLGIVEFDEVDRSNLQRQILHGESDLGRPKVDSAVDRLSAMNPDVSVEPYPVRLSAANALDIVARYDLVIDGSDNFPTRYLVNDACVLSGTPYVFGSILRWEGQVSVFGAQDGPCYRCLFREPPPPELVPTCAEAGVFGVLPGVVGSMQALEAIKWLLGVGESLAGRLLLFDGLAARWREVTVRRDPECPLCGDDPSITDLVDYERFCGITPDAAAADSAPEAGGAVAGAGTPTVPVSLTAPELVSRLADDPPPLLVDVREAWEWAEGNLADRGALNLPLAELGRRHAELPRDRALVFLCSVGARSAGAAQYLRDRGHPQAANLRGGLAAWVREVDPDLPVV